MFTEFQDNVSKFIKVTAKEADQLLQSEKGTIVFIGRETCPYCQKFVKKLSAAQVEKDLTIYYVNSQNTEDLADLSVFRDKYTIPTVPGLLFSNPIKNRVDVRCDSSMSIEEIFSFVQA